MVRMATKRQTIRAFRGHRPQDGQIAYLYYGMRTKHCIKLGEYLIKKVQIIAIFEDKQVCLLDDKIMSKYIADILISNGTLKDYCQQHCATWLTDQEKDQLAWADGFRKENDILNPTGCLDLMLDFWKSTHSLPFIGNLIEW